MQVYLIFSLCAGGFRGSYGVSYVQKIYSKYHIQRNLTCVRNSSGNVLGGSKQWRHSHFGKDGVHFLSIPQVKVRSALHEVPFTQNSFPKVLHLTVTLVSQLRLPSHPTVSTSLLPSRGSVQLTTRIKLLNSHDKSSLRAYSNR